MKKFNWHKDMQELIDTHIGDVGIKIDDILVKVNFKLEKYDLIFPFYERITNMLLKADEITDKLLENDYDQNL